MTVRQPVPSVSRSAVAISADGARRIALAAQGFTDPRPAGRVTVRHFRRVLDRMQVLQLDSVNVVARSHFLPLFSRLGAYDRDRLDQWLWRSGENLEYLAHEASITPVEVQPLLRWRMQRGRWKAGLDLEGNHPEYLGAVFDEITRHGYQSVKTMSDPGSRTGPWWGMPKGKLALEWLYVTGRLAIHHRDHQFTTHYDLPERVIAATVLAAPTPTVDEAIRALVLRAARAQGIGTATDLADYFRLKMPAVRPVLAQLVADGELIPAAVQGWDQPAYLHPQARQPRTVTVATVLSPFDPVVWFRPRTERLFGFHYRIEIYVPEAKRRFGYYVLPFLLDGNLVGRLDLKADRAAGVLRVRAAHAETGVDHEQVASAMVANLAEVAAWLGLGAVAVEPVGNLAPALHHHSLHGAVPHAT